jgi:hypothetical protein
MRGRSPLLEPTEPPGRGCTEARRWAPRDQGARQRALPRIQDPVLQARNGKRANVPFRTMGCLAGHSHPWPSRGFRPLPRDGRGSASSLAWPAVPQLRHRHSHAFSPWRDRRPSPATPTVGPPLSAVTEPDMTWTGTPATSSPAVVAAASATAHGPTSRLRAASSLVRGWRR